MSTDDTNGQGHQDQEDDMALEYDFSRGTRGKHAATGRIGYTIVIHRSDGTTEVREVASRPGTVVLDPDVRAYFPDSEAVNRALTGLIRLVPQRRSSSEAP